MNSLVQCFLPTTTDVNFGTAGGQTFSDSISDPASATWLSYHQPSCTDLKVVHILACYEGDLSLEVENLTEVRGPRHGGIGVGCRTNDVKQGHGSSLMSLSLDDQTSGHTIM